MQAIKCVVVGDGAVGKHFLRSKIIILFLGLGLFGKFDFPLLGDIFYMLKTYGILPDIK